jgi:serine/threonine-protein kinase
VAPPSPAPARRSPFDHGSTGAWSFSQDDDGDTERRPAAEELAEVAFDLSDATEVESREMFASRQKDPHVGVTLGSYTVVRQLARGGMGVVYLGRHLRLGRKVAIKLPHLHVLRDSDLRRRFLSEAMAAVQICHPGVVNVLDYGHAQDETPYLVMELLEGARVADTLAAAHESGVIHRDLKPENVFLQRHRHRPERITIKVLDFGFAKLVGGPAAGGIAPLTQQGLVIGTPCYMSPEQCLGFAPVDHRTDVYSLGCILYEMVAGRLPFTGGLSEVKMALRYRPAVPPRWHNREIPAELDRLIMKMLAKRPGERPSSMIELSRALERIGGPRGPERGDPTGSPATPGGRRAITIPAPPGYRRASTEPVPAPPGYRRASTEPGE